MSILSFCTLSILAASHHRRVLIKSVSTLTPKESAYFGRSDFGPHIFTSAPRSFNAKIFDNATLLCKISPIIAIFLPFISPSFSLSEKQSSNA